MHVHACTSPCKDEGVGNSLREMEFTVEAALSPLTAHVEAALQQHISCFARAGTEFDQAISN